MLSKWTDKLGGTIFFSNNGMKNNWFWWFWWSLPANDTAARYLLLESFKESLLMFPIPLRKVAITLMRRRMKIVMIIMIPSQMEVQHCNIALLDPYRTNRTYRTTYVEPYSYEKKSKTQKMEARRRMQSGQNKSFLRLSSGCEPSSSLSAGSDSIQKSLWLICHFCSKPWSPQTRFMGKLLLHSKLRKSQQNRFCAKAAQITTRQHTL